MDLNLNGRHALITGSTRGIGLATAIELASMGASVAMGGLGSDINYGVVNVPPSARDGHSSDISMDGVLFVFGGDRHLMPFNDLYVMQLDAI